MAMMMMMKKPLLLLLVAGIPLLQSLISSSHKFTTSSSSQVCLRCFSLEAKRNIFRRNDFDCCSDSIIKKKHNREKSVLFSSSARGITQGSTFDEKYSKIAQRGNGDISRTLSAVGGLLSILITRDIWYAATSILIINIFSTQSSTFSSLVGSFGKKFDDWSRNLSKEVKESGVFNFLKAVNDASLLNEVSSPRLMTPKRLLESDDHDRQMRPTKVVLDNDDLVSFFSEASVDINLSIASMTSADTINVGDNISPFEADISPVDLPSVARQIVPVENIPVSQAVLMATIEVQAAADAASSRLNNWLIQQKLIEEEKRRVKRSTQNLPQERNQLLLQLASFATKADTPDLVGATVESIAAARSIEGKQGQNGSFSARAIETSLGTINDFVTVLTSQGKNSLKQRYRQLTKEFHPDSARNKELPSILINALMSNLTGINSLSEDGHTLMSIESPWGMKYTYKDTTDLTAIPDTVSDDQKVTRPILKEETFKPLTRVDNFALNSAIMLTSKSDTDLQLSKVETEVLVAVDHVATANKYSPYNSPKQVALWKNWGKDIDWSQMKFQGSDIYTKAQEQKGKEGSSAYNKRKAVTDKKDKNYPTRRVISGSSDLPLGSVGNTLGSVLPLSQVANTTKIGQKFIAAATGSVRDAYMAAAPPAKSSLPLPAASKHSKQDYTSAVMLITDVINDSIDDITTNTIDFYSLRTPSNKMIEKSRIPIVTASAAQVLKPPSIPIGTPILEMAVNPTSTKPRMINCTGNTPFISTPVRSTQSKSILPSTLHQFQSKSNKESSVSVASAISSIDSVEVMLRVQATKDEAREWVERVMSLAKGTEIKARLTNINKQSSSTQHYTFKKESPPVPSSETIFRSEKFSGKKDDSRNSRNWNKRYSISL